jgi:hypothetical protein
VDIVIALPSTKRAFYGCKEIFVPAKGTARTFGRYIYLRLLLDDHFVT